MPVGWNVAARKSAALDKIDARIARLKEDQKTVLLRAGEAAIGKNNSRIDALREQHTLIAEKIALLNDLRREFVNDTDYLEW